MVEKSAAAVQIAPSRPPVVTGKMESLTERFNRTYDAIARRAYELFESEGRANGNDVRHWLEAEKQILLPIQFNLAENDGDVVVRAEVPGFTANDLEVNVEPQRMTITGKRESKSDTERSSTEIFQALDLPCAVNTGKVSATLKDGVLLVQLPKAETKRSAAQQEAA